MPIYFTPSERQHARVRCGGIQIVLVDWKAFDPLVLGVTLAVTLRAIYSKEWQPEGLLRLLASKAAYDDILACKPVAAIMARWTGELEEFRRVRWRYLLY